MNRRTGLVLAGSASLLALLVAAFLLTRGDEPSESSSEPADARGAESAVAGPGRPDPAGIPSSETEAAAPEREAAAASRTPGTAASALHVRGRLVVRGGAPLGEATVIVRTGKDEIDHAEIVARLGGIEAVDRLRYGWNYEDFEDRIEALGGWQPSRRVAAAADGSFAFSIPADFPAFHFEVEADFAARRNTDPMEVADPRLREEIVVELDPAGRIAGTIRLASGAPVPRGRVLHFRSQDTHGMEPPVTADDEGRFAIRGVARGKYELVAGGRGGAPTAKAGLEVSLSETTRVDFDLPAESFADGKVVDPDGRGIAGAAVFAHGSGEFLPGRPTHWLWGLRYGRGRTAADGSFRIGSLSALSHSFMANAPGFLQPDPASAILPPGGGATGIVLACARGRTVAGRIVNRDGMPEPGLVVMGGVDGDTIKARGLPWPKRVGHQQTATAADGSFRLDGLSDALVFVQVRRGGTYILERRGVEPGTEDLALVVGEATGISGSVRNAATGSPIRAFEIVQVQLHPRYAGGTATGNYWRTDGARKKVESDTGEFEWCDLTHGLYEFRAEANGYSPATVAAVEVKAGETRRGLEFALISGATIEGRVVERATGAPIAGAVVRLFESEPWRRRSQTGREPSTTKTAEDGAFAIPDLPAGTVRLVVVHDRFVEAATEALEATAGATIDAGTIALARGGAVEGIARDEKGVAYAAGQADGALEGIRLEGSHRVEIAADGRFLLEGLAPGKWTIRAYPRQGAGESWDDRNARELSAVAVVEEGKTTRVELRPPPSGKATVRGRVVTGAKGVRGAQVSLERRPRADEPDAEIASLRSKHTQTDGDGVFRFEAVLAGDATVFVHTTEQTMFTSRVSTSQNVVVPETGEVVVDVPLAAGRITGRVVRASDGASVPGCTIFAVVDGSDGPRARVFNVSAETDAEGRYALNFLSAGAYRVTANPRAIDEEHPMGVLELADQGPIEVAEGGRATVDFRLAAGGVAVVEVRRPDGRPAAGAYARLQMQGRRMPIWLPYERTADSAGIARFSGIPAGEYFASARTEWAAPFTEPAAVGAGEEVRFLVECVEGTRVRVRALGSDDAPLVVRSGTLVDSSGREISIRRAAGEEAGFLAATVLPGDYTLKVEAPGYRDAPTPIRVGSASPQEVVVRLERAEAGN